jgi:hypothetical protein
MYPASVWRIALRALDDDARVSVLPSLAVTWDAFSTPGFPARRWTVLSSSFSPQQTVVELLLTFVVEAVEKWKAFCAFQAQRLFHGHQAAASCSG